jgi:parafibromin
VPIVHRPDRRDLSGYLEGTIQKKDLKSIDQSAPLQMPTNFKRSAEEKIDSGIGAKKPRLEQQQSQQSEIKKRLADKLNTAQEGKGSNKPLKNLSDDLTTDKIAAIRAKLLSNRRTRVKPEDDDTKAPSMGLGVLEGNSESRDIFSRERVWRNRTTILQSSGKTFSKTVTAILGSVKAREDGRVAGKQGNSSMAPPPPQATPRLGMPPQRQALPNYNRYDQEQFRDKDDTHEFNIDKTGTFSGMTLKSVTEGNQAARNKNAAAAAAAAAANAQKAKMPNAGGGVKSGAQSPGGGGGGGSGGKRPSRTPIIIIPAAPKSLMTMYNAKDVLQDLKFVSTDDKKSRGEKRENELLIQRRKEGGLTVPYRVIDNPSKLTNADWDRVVAVFVMGQAWQFKGWPWDGNPTVIFSKIAAYHLKWDDMTLEKNIGQWAVSVIQLSREKRHLDRAKMMTFWESLDKYMVNNKPHLRF